MFLLLNGKLAFLVWSIVGDDFHVTRRLLADLPAAMEQLAPDDTAALKRLAGSLEEAMQASLSFKQNAGKRVGSYNLARCREITDASDRIFLRSLGMEDLREELDAFYARAVKTAWAASR